MSSIKLTYLGKDYTLEYNRTSVRTMESQGFEIGAVSSKPVTMIPVLFYGAFMKNHPKIKRTLVDEIYEHVADKADTENGLVFALMEMYSDTVNTLVNDNEENEGNVATWSVVK